MKIIDGKSPAVFKKYRKELNEVIKGTLYNYVKDAFRIQLNKFTTDDIVSKRDSIENAIERYLTQALAKENFQMALIIVVLCLLPIANIILFAAFIIYYAIHAGWNPNECNGYTHVFSLRGGNIVTKGLLKVKNLLCKRV